jgi:hypothetical protein
MDTLRIYGDDVYEVEKILERKKEHGKWMYKVRWKGYPPDEDSWEPGVNISANALRDFWNRNNIAPRRTTKASGGPHASKGG